MSRISLDLEPSIKKQLKSRAALAGVSISALLRELINDHLKATARLRKTKGTKLGKK